jgi:hypothetical protein
VFQAVVLPAVVPASSVPHETRGGAGDSSTGQKRRKTNLHITPMLAFILVSIGAGEEKRWFLIVILIACG